MTIGTWGTTGDGRWGYLDEFGQIIPLALQRGSEARCPNCLALGEHDDGCPKAHHLRGAGVDPYQFRLAISSLDGRARALDQLAGMVQSLPFRRARNKRRRDYLVGELRDEARRARYDLDQVRSRA